MRMSGHAKAEPRFDLDLSYGRAGELQMAAFYRLVADGSGLVEVKRKRLIDLELYVETECDKGATGHYTPSGISVTTAATWCFVIADSGIHVAIPTALLRTMLTAPSSRPKEEHDGDCPTRGMLINFGMLLRRFRQVREREAADRAASAMDHRDIPWGQLP